MKIKVPHLGEIESCFDDSCDGAHCKVCGGHFLDFHNHDLRVCDRCDTLDLDHQEEVKAAISAEWAELFPDDGLGNAVPPWVQS